MKKILVSLILVLASGFSLHAQVKYGITGGYVNMTEIAKSGSYKESYSVSAGVIGLFAEFQSSDKLYIQPELKYQVGFDAVDFLQIPVVVKYYLTDQFNVQAGPQLSIVTESIGGGFTNKNFGLIGGVGLSISDSFQTNLRYSYQLNDHETSSTDFSDKIHFLSINMEFAF